MSTASEWRKARESGIEVKFPSGATASIRPMEVDFFVMNGDIPDALAGTITKMLNNESYMLEIPPSEKLEDAQAKWIPFLNRLVKYAFLSPRVVDEPQDESELGINEIGYADKVYLYTLLGRPALVLREVFRKKDVAVESVVPQPDDVPAPVEDAQDQPVGQSDHRNARHVDRLTA